MDGNRRYAKSHDQEAFRGHISGYKKLIETIHWCMDIGVEYISVFAFSIDNFKRSEDEVGSLMSLAEEKYIELAKDHGLADREGIRMLVIGDLNLAPEGVQVAAENLVAKTSSIRHRRATLNICFCYTSTEDLIQAVDLIRSSLQKDLDSRSVLNLNFINNKLDNPSDLSSSLSSSNPHPKVISSVNISRLESAFRTHDSPPIDLLIRTSGETRLSDFMTWQCSNAYVCILPALWPDLGLLDFYRCILEYQVHARNVQQIRDSAEKRIRDRVTPVFIRQEFS
eukprot:CAMPEP_0175074108 /NCGR_PEP_ID=MMETSP0052_2-20121109/21071_1 /TAXON_ID=51329 ORGANISM="Polytomella parva, Strain SAG 63-3" /NCGR_SAMPLE_ID=MMETSP0052_2 /ASSEMBLY_ACC=CAM_ASM_000194 /LENGTH=281 /DNA_ID=CAMNT_0016342265 /DNA_START=157 /DNA_END=1002 /DNA_ORIENTATION=+